MFSSPYPVPRYRTWGSVLIIGWTFGVAGGVWAMIRPPISYDGLTVGITILWGLLLIVGSATVLAGHLMRRHRVEMAGLWPTLGGVALYAYLSWQAALTDSPGTGPRACLMILLLCLVAARLQWLRRVEKRVQTVDRIGGNE